MKNEFVYTHADVRPAELKPLVSRKGQLYYNSHTVILCTEDTAGSNFKGVVIHGFNSDSSAVGTSHEDIKQGSWNRTSFIEYPGSVTIQSLNKK